MKHTIFPRRALAFLLTLTLLFALALPALAASSATAADMRLVKTEGKVTIGNQSGKTLSVRDNMKLYSGYTISTDAESYAWLTLDAEKAVKLDANSSLEVRKKGKKLELLLADGQIFFDVKAPLEDGETMNIRTSTMVTGIRGTMGLAKALGQSASLSLYEGTALMTSLQSGQSLLVTAGMTGLTNPSTAMLLPTTSMPGFAATEIAGSSDLTNRYNAANEQSIDSLVSDADSLLANDQADAAAQKQQLDTLRQEWNGSTASAGNSLEISDQTMAEYLKTGTITKPGSTPVTQPTTYYVREALTATELTELFTQHDSVTITNGGSVTIELEEVCVIPKGKILVVENDPAQKNSVETGLLEIQGRNVPDMPNVMGELVIDFGAELHTMENCTIILNGTLSVNGKWVNHTEIVGDHLGYVTVDGTFDNHHILYLETGSGLNVTSGGVFTIYETGSFIGLYTVYGSVVNYGLLHNTGWAWIHEDGKVENYASSPKHDESVGIINESYYYVTEENSVLANYGDLFNKNYLDVYDGGTLLNQGEHAYLVNDYGITIGYAATTPPSKGSLKNENGATFINNLNVTVLSGSTFDTATGTYIGQLP